MKIAKVVPITLLGLFIFWSLKAFVIKDGEDDDLIKDGGPGTITEKVQSFSLEGFSEDGEKTWQIEGKTADIYSDVINLTDINADSYGRETTANLKSENGIFDRTNNNIKLKDNVVLLTSDGSRLTTESLAWNAEEELISTEDYVYIEREDMDAEGVGALAKPNLKRAQLNKDIKVNVKKPQALITCDGPLEIDYSNNIAYFNRNVELDDKKARIKADKATAYFDPKERVLTRVLCEGNVDIKRGEDITRSERLTYLPDEGRVILEGRPQIIIGSAEELLEEAKK